MKHRLPPIVLFVIALLLTLSTGALQAQGPVEGVVEGPLGGPPFTDMFTY